MKNIDFPWPVAQMIYQHHEKWNGSGYPRGLAGEGILLEARILAVADVVEAMPQPATEPGDGSPYVETGPEIGILYDSEMVDTCVRLFTEKGFNLSDVIVNQ